MTLKHLTLICLSTLIFIACKKDSTPDETKPELVASKDEVFIGEKVLLTITNFSGKSVWWHTNTKFVTVATNLNGSAASFTFLKEGTYSVKAIIQKEWVECVVVTQDDPLPENDSIAIRLYKTITVSPNYFKAPTQFDPTDVFPIGDDEITIRPRLLDSAWTVELIGKNRDFSLNHYFAIVDSSVSDERIKFTILGSIYLPEQPERESSTTSSTFHFPLVSFSYARDYPIEITLNGKLYTGVFRKESHPNKVEIFLNNGDDKLYMINSKFE